MCVCVCVCVCVQTAPLFVVPTCPAYGTVLGGSATDALEVEGNKSVVSGAIRKAVGWQDSLEWLLSVTSPFGRGSWGKGVSDWIARSADGRRRPFPVHPCPPPLLSLRQVTGLKAQGGLGVGKGDGCTPHYQTEADCPSCLGLGFS